MLATALILRDSVADLEASARRHPTAATYRALADAYVDARMYSKASDAFTEASHRYGLLGDPNAAKVLSEYANRYRTTVRMFYQRPSQPGAVARYNTGARLEPVYGCYLGVNVEREDGARDPERFDDAIGKKHAFFFMYRSYGAPFPSELAQRLASIGAGLQIALEPRSLSEVRDDRYLRGFARAAGESGIPIFLRFAGEMNGDWTPYHSDPDGYRYAFQTVYRVMHEETKNVALVWCPNDIPEQQIQQFFPGDSFVDWVGVNFYSVPFNDANRARGAAWRNPADSLDFIYKIYSAKHPIMIGEWAASHRSVVDGQPIPDFATDKIGQLYSALPRLYPRVKCADWLSMNTIEYAMPGRRLNDYSLLDDSEVASKYADAVSEPYFLSSPSVDGAAMSPVEIVAASPAEPVEAPATVSAYVRSYDQRPTIIWSVNGHVAKRMTEPGSYALRVDGSDFVAGKAKVDLVVRDSRDNVVGKATTTLLVQPRSEG